MIRTFFLLSLLRLSTNGFAQVSDFSDTDFTKADSIARAYSGAGLADITDLSHKLTKPLRTEQEKFRAIYKWVCDNIENDYSLYQKTSRQRAKLKNDEAFRLWNKQFNDRVFHTLFEKQKTICSGYAFLIRELALHAGLSCEIINGYGRTAVSNVGAKGVPNHTWNAVELQGKWYLCDATWSSGAIDLQQSRFIPKFNEAYFLAAPALFIRNHYPLDTKWSLLEAPPTLPDFLIRPVIYSSFYDYNITELKPDALNVTVERRGKFSIQFKSSGKTIDRIRLDIKGPGGINSVTPAIYRNDSGVNQIDHIFSSKGKHIVHVLLDEAYAFTYTVHVE